MADNGKHSELFSAVEKNDEETVKRLVEKEGVCIKSTTNEDEQTAAHIAALHGNVRLLTYLLNKNPDLLYVADKREEMVLHAAAKKGHLPVFKTLVEKFSVNVAAEATRAKENTAVHMAAEEGHLPIVKYYVEEHTPKGNPNFRNGEGEPLMMAAAKKAQLPIVRYLVEEAMADPTLVDNYDGNIFFHSAIIGDLTVPKYLLETMTVTLDADFRNMFDMTVVFVASRFNRLDFVKYFVEQRNATVDIPNNMLYTPLHEAARLGHLDVVKYLVGKKASVERKEMHGKKPVELAKKKEVVEFLEKVLQERQAAFKHYHRDRRSLSEKLFVRPSLHPPTSIPCRWMQNVLTDQFHSAVGQIEDSRGGETAIGVVSSLDSLLTLAGVGARYARPVRYERAKHQSLLSPKEIVQNRMDPIAFIAIGAKYNSRVSDCE